MNDQYIALSSLVMDLKRASLGFARGSDSVGNRFLMEALKRKSEVKKSEVPVYIQNIFEHLESRRNSDDLLMYSVILQNYLTKNLDRINTHE